MALRKRITSMDFSSENRPVPDLSQHDLEAGLDAIEVVGRDTCREVLQVLVADLEEGGAAGGHRLRGVLLAGGLALIGHKSHEPQEVHLGKQRVTVLRRVGDGSPTALATGLGSDASSKYWSERAMNSPKSG
jgi:hypothetical protein